MAQRTSQESIQSRPSTPQPQDSSLSEPHPDQSAQDEGKHRHHLQQKLRSPAPQPDQDKPQQPLPPSEASPAPAPLLVPQPSSAGSAQAQPSSSTTPGTATPATASASATATTTSTSTSTPIPDLQPPSKDAISATTCKPPVETVETTGAGQSSVRSGDQGIATDSASTITTTATTNSSSSSSSSSSSAHQDPRAIPSEAAPPLADTVSGQHPQYHQQQQVGAPHNGSAPRVLVPTPMSYPQQPAGPPTPRQTPTMNYPAPSPYPPAGMPPGAQYAYGPQAVAHVDPYRTSQTALPSMRTFDHVQQQHPQHQMPLPNHMAVSMAPNQMSYYQPMHPAYQMHHGQSVVHYALTGLTPDPRIALSGGRHKKEIKRRTKTGCLTCRKRRIKCDEAHPTCNNCKKSKRDCLGYDPIFKQQQQQQQQQHQQTLAAQSTPKSQHSAPASLTSTPTVPSSSVPPSPYQSQAQPYQQQQQQQQSPPPPHHYHQQAQQQHPVYQHPPHPTSYPPSHASNTPYESPVSSTSPGFDYGSAIDPALSGTDTPSGSGTPTSNSQLARPDDRNFGAPGHFQGATPAGSPLSATSFAQQR